MDLTLAAAALAVGFSGSLHCLLMCGPLACASLGPAAPGQRRRAALGYHGARVVAYATVGLLAGGLGGAVSGGLRLGPGRLVPWLLVATLAASALNLRRFVARRLRPAPGVAHILRRALGAGARFSPVGRAALLGALTPLLPCGLLYGMLLSAAATSSSGSGALMLGAFALGAVPALGAAQLQAQLAVRAPAWVGVGLERALPALAAIVIAWRTLSSGAPCH